MNQKRRRRYDGENSWKNWVVGVLSLCCQKEIGVSQNIRHRHVLLESSFCVMFHQEVSLIEHYCHKRNIRIRHSIDSFVATCHQQRRGTKNQSYPPRETEINSITLPLLARIMMTLCLCPLMNQEIAMQIFTFLDS